MSEWLRMRDVETQHRKTARVLGVAIDPKVYHRGEVRAIVTSPSEADPWWRLSVSCAARYPTWDEIADARYDLLPLDLDFALPMPPPGDYLNASPFVFNVIEARYEPGQIDRGRSWARTHESAGR